MRKLEVQIYGFVSYLECGTFKVAMQLKHTVRLAHYNMLEMSGLCS